MVIQFEIQSCYCNVPIHEYVKCTSNVHYSYIDNTGIPKNTWRLLSSGTKLFITFELKDFSIYGERYHLSMLTFPSAPPHITCAPATRPRWANESQPSSSEAKFDCLFSNLSPRFWCVTSFTSPYLGFLLRHLWMTHPPPSRAWTPALMLPLTNRCAKRKVLSLTKPKGKIYKTKSLDHYITLLRSLLECSPMARETWVQSQVESYQRL